MAEGLIGPNIAASPVLNALAALTSPSAIAPVPATERVVLAHRQQRSPTLVAAPTSRWSAVRDVLLVVEGTERLHLLRGSTEAWDSGHIVDIAVGAQQGLHLLEQHRYRLLFIDLQGNGISVIHAMRMRPELRPPAVVVLGNPASKAEVWGAIEAGADDYLMVPCEINDLALRIDLWLHRVGKAASNGYPGLHIHSLGHFRVMRAGKLCLQESGRARKVNTLFKYLLAHHGRTVHTGEVFEIIWPDEDEKVAAIDLRSLLYQLRKLLGSEVHGGATIHHTATSLGLHLGSGDWWDVQEFTAWMREAAHLHKVGDTACAIQAYEEAIELYQGDFLCDDRYVEWATPLRDRLREQWLKALTAAAALHAERGEDEAQEAALRTLLRVDPYREHNLRMLMELLAAQGRGAEALLLYRTTRDLLMAELNAHPDPETCALATYIGQRSR